METVLGIVILVLNLVGVIGLGIAIEHWFLTLVGYFIAVVVIGNINENVMGIVIIVVSIITLIAMIRQIVIKGKRNKLLKAVKNGDKSTVSTFISKGVDVADWYYGKETPLVIAFENNDIEMINILLNNINHLNYTPNNPLCMATQKGYKDIISLLIEKGANVNYEHARALDFAKDDEIIALLKSHGAKSKEDLEQEANLELERKKQEELEKETKYWQDLLNQRNKKIECNGCETQLDKYVKVCPNCGKKLISVVGKDSDCDFNTIQEALDTVEENSIIQVKPGVYNEHLDFNKTVHLMGCTETIIDKSSRELPIVVLNSNECVVDIPIKIEGIVFTHKKDLEFETLSSFLKTSSEIKENERGDSKSIFCVSSDSCFTNIAILCSEGFGVCIFDKNALFDISYLHQITDDGFVIYNNATPTINNCTISNSNGSGVYCRDNSSPKICNCEIYNCGEQQYSGVTITDESSAKIDSCKIYNSEGLGIAVVKNAKPTISSSAIFGHIQGISIEHSSAGVYTNCSVHSNKQCGLGICDESKPIINNCKFFDNGQHGIMIGDNSYLYMCDSEISNNGRNYAGIACLEKARVTIKNCKSFGLSSYGIALVENSAGNFENCDFNGVQEESCYVSNFVNCRT